MATQKMTTMATATAQPSAHPGTTSGEPVHGEHKSAQTHEGGESDATFDEDDLAASAAADGERQGQ
jgi:hypothetical protein